jgi:3-oxoadipate enol-lactonase
MTKRIRIGDIAINVLDRGSGATLLLVHGFPLDHTMWRGQIDELSQSCRVIAPDLRGFGQSDVTPGVVTMEQLADDMAALLDTLDISQPVTFCGLSMGGYVAWQFWRRHASRLKQLILCDTRAIADSPDVAQTRRDLAERVLAAGAHVVADAMQSKLFADTTLENQPEIAAATRRVMLATKPAGIAAALFGMASRQDMTAALSTIDVPALVICGQHDVISRTEEMQSIAAAMPRAQFVEIAGAGHMAPLESPQSVNAAIRRFLSLA